MEDEKSLTYQQREYAKERASIGETVKTQEVRAQEKTSNYRTTVRIRPTKVQLWQAIKLIEALGGKPEGRNFSWVCQIIFDSVIEQKVKEGILPVVSGEQAISLLKEFKNPASGMQSISLETMTEIKQIEEETNPENFTMNDLAEAERSADEEEIGGFFDFSDDLE